MNHRKGKYIFASRTAHNANYMYDIRILSNKKSFITEKRKKN
jgi:hypothetical protein